MGRRRDQACPFAALSRGLSKIAAYIVTMAYCSYQGDDCLRATVQNRQSASLVGLPPGNIDISAPGYSPRLHLELRAQAAKICRALQFTNPANFAKDSVPIC